MLVRILTVLSASLFLATSVAALPSLTGEANRPECQDALRIAQRAYDSTAFYLYEARGLPKGLVSRLIVQPIADIDLSGGDAVVADAKDFYRFYNRETYSAGRTYWQTEPYKGQRLVLVENGVGWRGNMHDLYAVPSGLDLATFSWREKDLSPFMADSWQVPWVLRRTDTGGVWVLDTNGWQVFIVEPGGAKPVCTVQFPQGATPALDLLPPEVRALADMLDIALGPGLDEGTLQPTGHLRYRTRQTWANVMLRPWALTRTPYNSRRQVDAGLKAWSRNGHDYKRLHARIYAQYPLAQQALADAYVARFGKTPEDAQAMAVRALDIAFRSYFVFPREVH